MSALNIKLRVVFFVYKNVIRLNLKNYQILIISQYTYSPVQFYGGLNRYFFILTPFLKL